MIKLCVAVLFLFSALMSFVALAQTPPVVGVSWSNTREERWARDESALTDILGQAGADVRIMNADSSVDKQFDDIEELIAQGIDVLIVRAQDEVAIRPSIDAALSRGIPVIGYDRIIEDPRVVNLSYDAVAIGRLMAAELEKAVPSGSYVLINGDIEDKNSHLFRDGALQQLSDAIAANKITIDGDDFTADWRPENAAASFAALLTNNSEGIDAVVSSNDAMAGAIADVMAARDLSGIPISGQDADHDALNRIAKGTQLMTVLKDTSELGMAAGETALELADGVTLENLNGATKWTTPRGLELTVRFLDHELVTRDNLTNIVEDGWIEESVLCEGVVDGPPPCD